MSLITRRDLLEAIEKCQGQKYPNANTCIKLAAYYTILDHTIDIASEHAYKSGPLSDFMKICNSRDSNEVIHVIDGMMGELQRVNPELYYDTLDKCRQL